MSPALPNIVFGATLVVVFLAMLSCIVFQNQLRKRATQQTSALSMILFALPIVLSMALDVDPAIFQRAYGETLGHTIFVLVMGAAGVGMCLHCSLNYNIRYVELPKSRSDENDTDIGAYT